MLGKFPELCGESCCSHKGSYKKELAKSERSDGRSIGQRQRDGNRDQRWGDREKEKEVKET